MARTIADALNELVNGEPNGLKPQINKKAPIDSPALTGTPTAPTPAEGDNSDKLATTEFVQNVVNKLLSFADSDLDTFAEVIDEIKAMRSAQASSTDFGMVKVGSNINVVDGTISLTKNNVVNALGYTPPTTAGSPTALLGTTGSSTTAGMTQSAITNALNDKLNKTDAANTYATKAELSNVSVDTSNLAKLNQSNTFTGNMYFGTSGRIERSVDGLVVGNKITSNGGYYMIAGETFMALGNSSSSGSNKCFINLNWTNSGKVEITAPNGLYVNGTKIS